VQKIFGRTPVLIFFILFSIALITLNVIRILHVSLTYDEVSPYFHAPYMEFVRMTQVTANNHILNSMARKFFTEILIDNEFCSRLPNLLLQVVYLFSGAVLCKDLFKQRNWQVGTFIFLNLNPFMFEFWGLSRGYGMAIGFMLAGICFFFLHLRKNNIILLYLSLFSAILSVYSNFTLLNFYLALLSAIVVEMLLFKPRSGIAAIGGKLLAIVLNTTFLYILIAEPIRKLREANQLFYGGYKGLFPNTLKSLIRESFYLDVENAFVNPLAYLVVISIFIPAIYWLQLYFRRKTDEQAKKGMLLCIIFFVPLILIELQHRFLGTLYVIERTALFLTVLYGLYICSWLYYINSKIKGATAPLLAFLCALSVFNFCRNVNTDVTRSWSFNKHDLVVLRRVITMSINNPNKIKLRVHSVFNPTMQQHITAKYPYCFEPLEYTESVPTSNDTGYDFFYITKDDLQSMPAGYVIDTSFFKGEHFLLKKAL
jgi:hypothetical protein